MASVITSVVTATVTAKPTTTSATSRAASQGGILEGLNPSKYDPKNPLILFIIQAGIIIIFCRILHFPLSKLRQPRVIAEIIGGILLGPSVFGRIPGFTDAIFPTASMPTLTLAANLGLVLFLFLVGLEVDLRLLLSNWRVALSVGAAGMALPFGLGCAIAYGLYQQFRNDPSLVPIGFGTYMLFVGVAMAITAFPVLCRILTELKLLQTQVGIVVLSAGVGNDVVGWILLALCVALVNAGDGIVALYVLLTCVAYILFLVYAVRPVFLSLLKRSGSIQYGPTQTVVALTVLMMLASAFFTGIIGVHPIFGAFLVGLICPHDGGFAIKLTEKIEDLVSVFFLPLYFALSGLSTNIGLLDSGITWAYVFGVIAVAFVGKFVGGTVAARLCKLVWRESFTIGVLMSCKGLVELIVLNIGYQAKILSQRTFTIFVVMALVTTFATTPLTSALYPPWYQKKIAAWKRGEIDWDGNSLARDATSSEQGDGALEKYNGTEFRKLLVYLRLESLPSLFTFVALLGGDRTGNTLGKTHPQKAREAVDQSSHMATSDALSRRKKPLAVHGLRMLELTERQSSVMKESDLDDYHVRDPVVNAFHTFGQLSNVAISGEVQVVPEGSYAEILKESASEHGSDMVLLPWSETGRLSEAGNTLLLDPAQNTFTSGPHNHFVATFLAHAPCSTAIFVNKGFGQAKKPELLHRVATTLSLRSTTGPPTAPIMDRSHHVFFPFFGGPDDRVALRFVLRLAQNPNVTATIVNIQSLSNSTEYPDSSITPRALHSVSPSFAKEATAQAFPEPSSDQENAFFVTIKDSLPHDLEPRVVFSTINTESPLHDTLEWARREMELPTQNAGNIVVVGRDVRTGGRRGIRTELEALRAAGGASTGVERSLGAVAEAVINGNIKASVLVVQAGGRELEG
ncbi:K(+)/H(+) antiporter [Sticta canariensis]|nr:K(+)/H(+) antiporter [Sticta canariensis]